MKPLVNLTKKFFPALVALLGVLVLGLSVYLISNKTSATNEIGGTMSYLKALCDKDYASCDMYIARDGFYLTGFEGTTQSVFNPISSDIYYQFIDYAVDSIESISILSVTNNKSTGYTDYEIEITYKPYKKVDELDVDVTRLNALMDKYTSDRMLDDEFAEELQKYYLELFKTCFVLDDKENVTSKVLILSEKEENGVVYVYNTKTFIEGFISDEMYSNLEVYQTNIKAKVNTVLRQY